MKPLSILALTAALATSGVAPLAHARTGDPELLTVTIEQGGGAKRKIHRFVLARAGKVTGEVSLSGTLHRCDVSSEAAGEKLHIKVLCRAEGQRHPDIGLRVEATRALTRGKPVLIAEVPGGAGAPIRVRANAQ